MVDGITRGDIRMGVVPLQMHLPWMGSATVLANPLLEVTPRRVRIRRTSPREPFFCLHFRSAFFLYLSADVDSPCIIAVVDFVRYMRFFLSFTGIVSFLPFVPPLAFTGR